MNPAIGLKISRYLLALGLLLLGIGIGCSVWTLAGAQTQPLQARAVVSWVLPTTGCINAQCGLPLTGDAALTGVRVYASTAPISDPPAIAPVVTLPGTATTYTYTTTVPNGSTLYFRLQACNAQMCGLISAQDSKQIRIVLPGAVTGVSVEVTVTITTTAP